MPPVVIVQRTEIRRGSVPKEVGVVRTDADRLTRHDVTNPRIRKIRLERASDTVGAGAVLRDHEVPG